MKFKQLGFIILTVSLFACSKDDKEVSNPVPPPPPAPTPADTFAVRLKDVVIQNLPSPYYHFNYNDSGYISSASFAASTAFYDFTYANKRVKEQQNNIPVNRDKLLYEYENGKVSLIKIFNKDGILYKRAFLAYNSSGQLINLVSELKAQVGFVLERELDLTYHADGNLHTITNRFIPFGTGPQTTSVDTYEDYDTKMNVDGFSLLHFNDQHLYILPTVKLQKNNPRINRRSGDGLNYQITYTYSNNAKGWPLIKTGELVFTTGPNAEQRFQVMTTYSYYE